MKNKLQDASPTVYVVSGGAGTSGEQVVNTVLAQFPEKTVPVVTFGSVLRLAQIAKIVSKAEKTGGIIVHSFVDTRLRTRLISLAEERNIREVDLMGPLLHHLSQALGCEPLGRPGLYRKLNKPYFDRISAIEYAMPHDDGQNPCGWTKADVLLIGLSRTGKTPLSIYLSVLGWKVANYPVVPEIPIPEELYEVDPARVIGLTIDADRLQAIRYQRGSRFGAVVQSAYADPSKVEDEIRFVHKVFRKAGFHVINVTNKTIESCADEIIKRISLT